MPVKARSLILVLSLLAVMFFAAGCAYLRPLLTGVQVTPATISPNADGVDDVTHIYYTVGRPVKVSIYVIDAGGDRHYFRKDQRRSPGKYDVYWGGVITDPQVRQVAGDTESVTSQVLPDGAYTWVIEATDDGGHRQQEQGQIALKGGDTSLPDLLNFTVTPRVFTPNQDGIGDWVTIAYTLTKKSELVQVFLEQPASDAAQAGLRYPIAEDPTATAAEPGDLGYHAYRYDGGVDLNAEPPPDGDYVIMAEAEDRVGNHVVVSSTLSIHEGGKPRADVDGGQINWQGEQSSQVAVPLGQTLCLTATVINIGPVPLRTTGPWPGQLYKFSENSNTLAQRANEQSWYQQQGSWRFGINFDTTGVDFPFRWAIGRKQDLEARQVDGETQYYLLPGHRGQVSGCILFDRVPPVGTQFWWGGLLHEGVEVANDQVDRIQVLVGAP